MTDKMREEFEEKFPNNAGFIFDGDTYVLPSGPTDSSLAIYCLEYRSAWRAWQAAKSVPVVGEPVAYACPFHTSRQFVNGTPCMLVEAVNVNEYGKERGFPLVVQPTTSITEAELQDLRMCKIAAQEEARRVDELTAELERLRKCEQETELLRAQLKYTLAQVAEREARITRLEAERVPHSATMGMIAAAEAVEDLYKRGTPETWGKVWRAMLAAAQQQKKEGE